MTSKKHIKTSKKHIKISLTSNFNLKCTISWTMLYNYSVSVQPGRGTVQLNQSNRLLSTLTGVSKLGRTTSIYNSLVASHRDGVYSIPYTVYAIQYSLYLIYLTIAMVTLFSTKKST